MTELQRRRGSTSWFCVSNAVISYNAFCKNILLFIEYTNRISIVSELFAPETCWTLWKIMLQRWRIIYKEVSQFVTQAFQSQLAFSVAYINNLYKFIIIGCLPFRSESHVPSTLLSSIIFMGNRNFQKRIKNASSYLIKEVHLSNAINFSQALQESESYSAVMLIYYIIDRVEWLHESHGSLFIHLFIFLRRSWSWWTSVWREKTWRTVSGKYAFSISVVRRYS